LERQFKTLKEAVSFAEVSALACKTIKLCLKTVGTDREQHFNQKENMQKTCLQNMKSFLTANMKEVRAVIR